MSLFSIIIPCFNCANTIEATLASVQAQTVADWDVICVDDGSSDDTLAVLQRLARSESRLRILRQTNAGPSRARNAAAAAAQGEFVAFLDADDMWLPEKLASVLAAFDQDAEADAVFGRIAVFRTEDEGDVTTSTVRAGRAKLTDFLGENPACTLSNLTVKRAAFLASGGFDESMRFSEDLEWLVRAAACGVTLVATDDLHVRYRTSEGGLSADLQAMHNGWRRAVASAQQVLPSQQMAAAEATHLRYLARRALRTHSAPRVAQGLALRGMRLAPIAFLGGGHRGPLTLLGCLTASLLPARIRHRLFN